MTPEQQDLSKALILSPTKAAPELDKFNMWMLAVNGGTSALLISNLSNLTTALKAGFPSWIFTLLAISGLFGLLAKLCSLRLQSALTVINHVELAIEACENINVDLALKDFLSVFPFWARFAGKKASEKTKSEPFYGYKFIARIAVRHGIYVLLQGLTFVILIMVASLGIK